MSKHLKKSSIRSPSSKSPKKINSEKCLKTTLPPKHLRSPRKKPLTKLKKSPN